MAKLTATFCKTVKKPGAYGDGRGGYGLTLRVDARTVQLSRYWYQKVRVNGVVTTIGLGSYPLVTLADARAKALANARIATQGRDPRLAAVVPTFRDAADRVIALHAASWKDGGKSAKQWVASLDTYAMPRLGDKRIDRITTSDVMQTVLTPIWNDKRETARRVRQRMSAIFKWAVANGYREDNPAGDAIGAALPKGGQKREHHRALGHADVAGALRTIRETAAWPTTKLAIEYVALTACRSGEVRGARWSEIDLSAKTWTVPAERMKAGIEHRVALSSGALAVLDKAREYVDATGLIFPSPRGKALSDGTLTKLMHENGIDAVVHGFRSSFRDWCGESGVTREVAEAALAHVVKNQVEAAYARSDLLERRREVMQSWADYIAE